MLHHRVVLLCPASLCLVMCLVHQNGSMRFQVARTQVCYTNDAHLPAPSLVALESATPTMLTCQNLRLPPFSRIICTIQISWDGPQTSNASVTASLKSLNKLPSTRFFIAAEKLIARRTRDGGFIFPENGNFRR